MTTSTVPTIGVTLMSRRIKVNSIEINMHIIIWDTTAVGQEERYFPQVV